jgi:hypothetical protein
MSSHIKEISIRPPCYKGCKIVVMGYEDTVEWTLDEFVFDERSCGSLTISSSREQRS